MRRFETEILTILLAIALFTPIALAQQPAPISISIVQGAETLVTLPLLYAKEAGLFEKVGLKVTWLPVTPNSAQVAAILDTGQADFGQAGASASLSAQAVGKDIVAIAMLTQGTFQQLVLTNEAMKTIASVTPASPIEDRIKALKGLKIAISPPGNTPELVFRTLLQNYGIDVDRFVSLIPTPTFPAMVPMARAGRADGYWLTPPFTTVPVVEGWGKIWIDLAGGSENAFKDEPLIVMLAKRSTLTSKPEASKRVIEALRLSFADIKQKPNFVRDLVKSKYFEDIDGKVFDIAFREMLNGFDHDMIVSDRGYDQLLATTVVTDVTGKPAKVPLDRAFDFSLLRANDATAK